MKTIIACASIFLFCSFAEASILVFSSNGQYVAKSTLSQAASSADCAGKRVVVTSILSAVQSNISSATIHTWPADRDLEVSAGGQINPTTKFTGLKYSRPEWFGANTIPGTTDMGAAINKAIKSTDGPVEFSATTYLAGADQLIAVQSDSNHPSPISAAFQIKSNMHLRGVPGQTIIKMKAGISSDAVPKPFNMFMSNGHDSNISFEGIIFDMNGRNNMISPARPTSYNGYQQAAIMWSGATARPDNIRIEKCGFINSAGTNVIVTGFSITTPAPLGVGFILRDSYFDNNGFDAGDHSTVYLPQASVLIENVKMTISSETKIVQNGVEVQGPNSKIKNLIVDGYVSGLGVVGGQAGADVNDVEITGCKFRVTFNPLWFWRNNTGANTLLYQVDVHDNNFELIDTASPSIYPQTPSGILLFPTHSVYDVQIHDNIITKSGGTTYAAYGIVLGNSTPGEYNDKIYIERNKVNYFTRGISHVGLLGTGGANKEVITGNTIRECTDSTIPVLASIGIEASVYVGQSMDFLYLAGNKIYNTGYIGLYLSGAITNIFYGADNLITNSGTANYNELGVTITNRYGVLREVGYVFDPISIASYTGITNGGIAIVGAVVGDTVTVGAPYDTQGVIASGYVTANNTVALTLFNATSGAVDLASGTWTIKVVKKGM